MIERTPILIADDQRLFADGLRVVLESREPRFEVVGVAENGRQAVEMADALAPKIVLMDVRMPEMDGVTATRLIHEKHPEIKILILTTFDDDEYVTYSLRNGAVGYLLKNRPAEELIDSIRALAKGIVQIDQAISAKLLGSSRSDKIDSDEFYRRLRSLTVREREVLGHLAKAKRIVRIADDLGIAEQTVRNHIGNIYTKLQIHDRLEIVNYVNLIRYYLDHEQSE
jgi:DNA-binding NarL/FixJ family response regulator